MLLEKNPVLFLSASSIFIIFFTVRSINKLFSYRTETTLQGRSVLAKSGRWYSAEVYLQPLWPNRPPKLSNLVK